MIYLLILDAQIVGYTKTFEDTQNYIDKIINETIEEHGPTVSAHSEEGFVEITKPNLWFITFTHIKTLHEIRYIEVKECEFM